MISRYLSAPNERHAETQTPGPNGPGVTRQASGAGAYARSGFSGRSSPRASTPPPASPGRGSGRGASRPGRSAGAGVPGTFGGGEAAAASAETSASVLAASSAADSSLSIRSPLTRDSEIGSQPRASSV